jgi:hypothetical protein
MTLRAAPYLRMTDYTIVVDGLHGFGVEVWSGNAFRSVRGFSTVVAAQAWTDLCGRAEELGLEGPSDPPIALS